MVALPSLACVAFGQSPATPAVKTQQAADMRALREARNQPDPEQRLATLRKFVVDYPKSTKVNGANQMVLTLLLDKFPDRMLW